MGGDLLRLRNQRVHSSMHGGVGRASKLLAFTRLTAAPESKKHKQLQPFDFIAISSRPLVEDIRYVFIKLRFVQRGWYAYIVGLPFHATVPTIER